jgi:hypothetical protein
MTVNKDSRYNYNYIKLHINEDQIKQCEVFARKFTDNMYNHYSKTRNQTDKERIYNQCLSSKKFEFMVYNYLNSNGQVTLPDTEIYEVKRKSFAADLIFTTPDNRKINIHIKSQEYDTIRNYEMISFGFQEWDDLYKSPKSNDWILAGVFKSDNTGQLILRKKAEVVMPLAAEPLALKLKGQKKFLYLIDIIGAGIQPITVLKN